MGSIAAIVGDPGDPELPRRLEQMLSRSTYRGASEYLIEDGLAIGVQKIGDDASLVRTKTHIVAFHGFVGNWPDLAIAHGLDLRGLETDAARVARFFETLDQAVIEEFRGEFSFLVYDRRAQSLVVGRDLFGLRPLFFHRTVARHTLIATEIRQILAGSGNPPKLNEEVLVPRLLGLSQPIDRSLYVGISRFVPGSVYSWRTGGDLSPGEPKAYWRPPAEMPWKSGALEPHAEELRELLAQAVRRCLPGGEESYVLALSGGVDSTSLWRVINRSPEAGTDPNRCIPVSVVYPGQPYDESNEVESNLAWAGRKGALLDASNLPLTYGSDRVLPPNPNGVIGAATQAAALLHEAAREQGTRVLLFGIGGDELFLGSMTYLPLLVASHPITACRDLIDYLRAGRPAADLWSKGLRPVLGSSLVRLRPRSRVKLPAWLHPRHADRAIEWIEEQRADPFLRSSSAPRRIQLKGLFDMRSGGFTDAIEQASAFAGVQYRYPFVDPDIVSFALSVPARWHRLAGESKSLLRRATCAEAPSGATPGAPKTIYNAAFAEAGRRMANEDPPREWRLTKLGILSGEYVDSMAKRAKIGDTDSCRLLFRLLGSEWFVRQCSLAPSNGGTNDGFSNPTGARD